MKIDPSLIAMSSEACIRLGVIAGHMPDVFYAMKAAADELDRTGKFQDVMAFATPEHREQAELQMFLAGIVSKVFDAFELRGEQLSGEQHKTFMEAYALLVQTVHDVVDEWDELSPLSRRMSSDDGDAE